MSGWTLEMVQSFAKITGNSIPTSNETDYFAEDEDIIETLMNPTARSPQATKPTDVAEEDEDIIFETLMNPTARSSDAVAEMRTLLAMTVPGGCLLSQLINGTPQNQISNMHPGRK